MTISILEKGASYLIYGERELENTATLFVVDDDPAARRLLGAVLEREGFAIELFDSGNAYLQAVDGRRRGCLLLDDNMPGMSGVELRDIVLKWESYTPTIFLSAYIDFRTAVNLMKSGVIDVIQKPFDRDALLHSVHAAIRREAIEFEKRRGQANVQKRLAKLTPRESEVMRLVADGLANKRIATALGISDRTVETHRSRIMEKLDVESVQAMMRHYDVFQTQTTFPQINNFAAL